MLSRTSLLNLSLCMLAWCAGTASSHAIRRTSVASSSSEPIFTIQTSMPSVSSTATPIRECFSDGSTFICPTSTSTQGGETEPVFCPAPTSLPSGLCFTTVTYTLAPTQTANISTTTSATSSSNLTTSTSVRTYPCAEKTTTYSSATYALNCIDEEANYVACPTNITLTPTPMPTSTIPASSVSQSTFTIAECTNEEGSTVSCPSTSPSSASIPSLTPTSTPTLNGTIIPSTIQRTRSIISQCFNTMGSPTSCPVVLCESPFETAPGPVIPNASLTLQSQENASSRTSERIFRTSPAPIITSFASVPAFLSNS